MTPPRSTMIIAVMGAVIALLAWALVYFARDEFRLASEARDDSIPAASAVREDDGFAVVNISAQSQKASGVETAALRSARSEAAAEIYGVVVDPRPLIEQRARLLAVMAQRQAAGLAATSAQIDHQRLKRLYDDERNVAERAMLAAEAQWKGEQARVAALEQQAIAIRDELRATWGAELASRAAAPQSPMVNALVQQHEALVQLVFPYDLQSRAGRDELAIAPVGSRTVLRPARFVSASPRTDASLPGATYFYLASGHDLRVGMRVAAQLRLSGKPRDGVLIPDAAVVWHGGKAWAYVKEGDARFLRREVSTAQELPGGWFNAAGFEEGEPVVVSGAQLLLSEEFKYQIRNENED